MNWRERIHSDPAVLLGKPVIKGTRISVELLLGRLADCWTEADIMASYPRITRSDLQAVFAYSYELQENTRYMAVPKSA